MPFTFMYEFFFPQMLITGVKRVTQGEGVGRKDEKGREKAFFPLCCADYSYARIISVDAMRKVRILRCSWLKHFVCHNVMSFSMALLCRDGNVW